jgi:E3 ubiquitin-protein ligase DOA10
MDFIEALLKCEGYSVILVVVDRFTKYAHFLPLKHPYTTTSIQQLFFSNIVKLHGLAKTILSDRDKVFTSAFWKELFRLLNTQLCMSSSYHAHTDGQTERINQCLEAYVRCAVSSTPK